MPLNLWTEVVSAGKFSHAKVLSGVIVFRLHNTSTCVSFVPHLWQLPPVWIVKTTWSWERWWRQLKHRSILISVELNCFKKKNSHSCTPGFLCTVDHCFFQQVDLYNDLLYLYYFLIFIPSPILKSLAGLTKNEFLKLTARFMKINSSNSGTRGCGAGHSRVTLNLSIKKLS